MQSIYNRIEVAFANADVSIFEKQNLIPQYNTLNELMTMAWDKLPHSEKEYYDSLKHEGENVGINIYLPTICVIHPTYRFRKEWIECNIDKEEYRPIIEGFKSYYNL